MARSAFSLVEIGIVLFLIVLVACIFVPLKVLNVAQAERVAKWKTVYEETRYSFEVLKAQNPSFINELNRGNLTSADAFDKIKPYLNLDEKKSTQTYFNNYNYRFFNSRRVKEKSLFYVKDFATLQSGVIIGFKVNRMRHTYKNTPVAMMIFDVNGLEKPNRIGKDIFGINIYKNDIKPFGDGHPGAFLKANCSPMGTGTFCSKYYLIGGNF